MNYGKIKTHDVANGDGVRVSLFVSGCRRKCKGCFNEQLWDFKYGESFTKKEEDYILSLLGQPEISGLSVLGGEPLEPENLSVLTPFLRKIKFFLVQKNIWLFTGFEYEQIKDLPILTYVDTLVDGPYIEEKKDMTPLFRGSTNQSFIFLRQGVRYDKAGKNYFGRMVDEV